VAGGDDFLVHVLVLLAPIGRVAAQKMFGGHGLYCDGVFFAIVHDGTLYLKADEHNRGEFERAGSQQFSYTRNGKRATLGFYQAPEDAMDAPHLMRPWAREAVAAALRSRAEKTRRRPTKRPLK